MKKKLLPLAAMLFSMSAFAQSPTATTQVYDLSAYGDGIIDVFYEADKAGLKFPTKEMWEKAGYDLQTIEFVRSHFKALPILDRATRLNQDAFETRNLWMNLPIGIGKEQGGYPSSNFSDDTFTAWNYTNLFGSWNHGLFHAPGVVGDAGHKNGTDVMAGIKFFESWTAGSGASGWVSKVQEKDANGYGGYAYVRPLVNACMYFGKDGINYNFEDQGYANCADFHAQCYKYAEECGMKDFHVGLYTAQSTLTASNVSSLLGTKGNQCYDTFLNYSASDFQTTNNIRNSVTQAKNAMGTCEDVYQGAWIVSMARSWKNLAANATVKEMGIVLWGEHSQSRFLSYNNGLDGLEFQENYQKLMDRFMSGGYRNPASRPAENNNADWNDGLAGFQGIAHYIPERSALVQNLPFTTYFSTGNGDRYNYKGKKTAGSWYNLGQQDVVPTYRWLVYEAGTTNPVVDKGTENQGVPYFTNRDAYIGGSCLKLTNPGAVDITLYRSELTVTGSELTATLAQKRVAGPTDGAVKLIVKKKGSTEWTEAAVFEPVKGNTWEEQTVKMTGVAAGDVIEYVGIRTTGDTKDLMLGQLTMMDNSVVTPAEIKDKSVLVSVVEECQKSMSVKLAWELEGQTDAWGMLYNQDAHVDHFEILYKDGENGKVSEIGRTTTWSAYAGNIPMTDATKPYVGVRAVSVDGKTYSEVQWVEVTRADKADLPEALSANGNYPAIILDNSSEGLDNALNQRYVESLVVKGSDADFEYINEIGTPYMQDRKNGVSDKNADKTNYILADKVIKVHQGQNVTLDLTIADFSDGLQWCTAWGYADWDCSEGFNAGNDEWFWKGGESNAKKYNETFGAKGAEILTVSIPLNVPEDAVTGNSRVRFVFSDAWFPHPGATGATAKGFAIDFPMEITGTNPGRQADVDTHDTGVADEPEGIGGVVDAIQTVKGNVSKATLEGNTLRLENTEKAWVISAEGRVVKYVNGNVDSIDTNSFAPGVYVVRMQNGQVQRTTKILVK